MEILKKGSKGAEVKALQEALKTLGYSLGIYGADGKFGSATEKALKKYQ
jgi:peptidoglycan hydrolase-like protein with peptidoglycan-binding domain